MLMFHLSDIKDVLFCVLFDLSPDLDVLLPYFFQLILVNILRIFDFLSQFVNLINVLGLVFLSY